jgi:hypothetical protein
MTKVISAEDFFGLPQSADVKIKSLGDGSGPNRAGDGFLPPPDIMTDCVYVVMGSSMFYSHRPIAMSSNSPTNITLVPLDPMPDGEWPYESGLVVQHELIVGTVDEIAEDFRQRLIAGFNCMTDKPGPGVPPAGEPSLRKQTEMFEQLGIDRLTVLPTGEKALRLRERRRNEMAEYEPRQPAIVVDRLKRLLDVGVNTPVDVAAIDKLIAELTILREDSIEYFRHCQRPA